MHNGWMTKANETGMKKAAEPTMTALFQQKRQQQKDPFTVLFYCARKREAKGVFGLITCRSDSCAAPVGVNFRLKQEE